MPPLSTLYIISDIHYGSTAEAARQAALLDGIRSPFRRWCVRMLRHHIWLRNPFVHNHLLDQFIQDVKGAELVVANGDYSCDSAYVGVCDDAAFQSAAECLQKLRAAFGERLHTVIGDHELGKKMLAADVGGLRLSSYERCVNGLDLKPFWQVAIGDYALIGVTSTLVALPVYAREGLPAESSAWERLRSDHLAEVRAAFNALKPSQRILLFCHDPTALPFLWREDSVRRKLPQIERTIIGHLHSPLMLHQARMLAGAPRIAFLGHTPLRWTSALREARHWKPFNILLCPALTGIELLKDGGYYSARLYAEKERPAQFAFRRLVWRR